MSKTIKNVVSLMLVVVMLATACISAISCGKQPDETVVDTYTYNTYTSSLGTNWNPHTWENNADSTILGYIETPLADMTAKDTETGEYQWIFLAATDVQDVTADHQDDLVKYGAAETDATEGYVYEIKLRPEMQWQDGTPINADTYIYSMKALLDPAMKNYRANNYYSGESALAGALAYYNQGSTVTLDTPDMSTLVKGDDGVYTTDDGEGAWIALDVALNYLGGYSLKFYVEYYGEEYFDTTAFASLVALMDENGLVKITDESLALLTAVISVPSWGEGPGYENNYVIYEDTFAECDYDSTVGLYKVDDYTIRYVCATAYDYYYFLTSCTSNWIVHEALYESCKEVDEETGLITSTYGTSLDTTMSYGPYRIDYIQEEKQMIYVQNENYFEYTKNEDGTLSSTSETVGFTVNGEYVDQWKVQKIVVDVMTDDAAKLAFLSGDLDDWTPSADEVVNYTTSEQLYQVDETYTMRLFFHTNLESLKSMDQAGNKNSVVMSNEAFRKALSLSIKRSEFVTATAGYKAAYYLINSLYFYDVYEDPASVYRNTEQAMQAVCNIYGVEYGEGTPYATLKEAYESVTGYNLTEAKALMKQACEELVAAGLYTAGDPIVIQMGWKAGTMDSSDQQQVALLNQYVNAAVEGSGFGKVELVAVDSLSQRYKDVAEGKYAIGYGAWGGAAFYPFTMFRVYCDAEYAGYLHEAGCWDPAVETLTLTINGEEVTMTWYEWSNSMTGTGKYANADNETKLTVLAAIEENFIEKYYAIPLCTTTACSMLSYKLSYFTENYNIMYGFGGLRLIDFNYTDAEWSAYVASQNNSLTY